MHITYENVLISITNLVTEIVNLIIYIKNN